MSALHAAGTGTIADLGSPWTIAGLAVCAVLLAALAAREVLRTAPGTSARRRLAALDVAVVALSTTFAVLTAVRLAALL